jgi:SWI/SNF-related matrix-associated actin-dependent regulator of chromatin subfamily A member 5
MGLGKTLQTISVLAYLRETRKITGPHLVIVPKSTVSNWMREFTRWCPSIRSVRLLGDKAERARVIKEEMGNGKFDVCVASYESMLLETRTFLRYKWKYVVIDEAHRIKNEKSSLSKIVRMLKSDFRLLITGTPLQNNLHELWALCNFLMPEMFGDSERFDEWFTVGDKSGLDNIVRKLHALLKPFVLRRVKSEVEKDLPPKRETKLYIGLSALQRSWYSKLVSRDLNALNDAGTEKVRLLNILMQLRKVCNHPYLFDGAEAGPPYTDGPHLWESSGKLTLIHKLLPKLQAQGSRVLIFSQMTRMLDILEDYLRIIGFSYCRIDGSTSGEDRDTAVDSFNKPGSDKFCFLLSTRAGGLGINLQTADTVILYDSDWNPQVDLQAMDRAHRIGQTKEVRVFRFITEGTVEEKVVERADRKLFLDAAVIQQGRMSDKNTALSKSELMTMVRFGADEIIKNAGVELSDEDIDAILARSEERTAEVNKLISTQMQHNLNSFSISMMDEAAGGAEKGFNLFTFEGETYDKKKKPVLPFLELVAPRERKAVSGRRQRYLCLPDARTPR